MVSILLLPISPDISAKNVSRASNNLIFSSKSFQVLIAMARKGKDTDVTVTVKTEEEWNKLIESEVTVLPYRTFHS